MKISELLTNRINELQQYRDDKEMLSRDFEILNNEFNYIIKQVKQIENNIFDFEFKLNQFPLWTSISKGKNWFIAETMWNTRNQFWLLAIWKTIKESLEILECKLNWE